LGEGKHGVGDFFMASGTIGRFDATSPPTLVIFPGEQSLVLFGHPEDEMGVRDIHFPAAPPDPAAITTIQGGDYFMIQLRLAPAA
jgi:hypothetical protein